MSSLIILTFHETHNKNNTRTRVPVILFFFYIFEQLIAKSTNITESLVLVCILLMLILEQLWVCSARRLPLFPGGIPRRARDYNHTLILF